MEEKKDLNVEVGWGKRKHVKHWKKDRKIYNMICCKGKEWGEFRKSEKLSLKKDIEQICV